jgi:hypothetical protein
MSIGLTSALAGPIEENEPLPAISNMITLSAMALIFSRTSIGKFCAGSALPIQRYRSRDYSMHDSISFR